MDIEDHISILLSRATSDLAIWRRITDAFRVDLFCALFLNAANRGIELSPLVLAQVAERRITVGFDIYAPAKDA